jgi:hypothetical protein
MSNKTQNVSNDPNNIHYEKRKNTDLFKYLEKPECFSLTNTQNYIPIYNRFFSLNDTNFNSINLNHKWYLYSIKNKVDTDFSNKNLFQCRVKNIEDDEIKNKIVFIKLAPLLDPFKYLIGKYNNDNNSIFCNLPNLNNNNNYCHPKLLDTNNCAYIDGFFVYLTSILKNKHNFNHGLEYYGSFLSIKNNFLINVFDDLDYLTNSDFFNKNKNVLFKIDDYEHLIKNEQQKLKTLKIDYNTSAKSVLSLNSINNEIFENLFNDSYETPSFTDNNVVEYNILDIDNTNVTTLKSNSTCSSRVSYTNSEISETNEIDEIGEIDEIDEICDTNENNETDEVIEVYDNSDGEWVDVNDNDDDDNDDNSDENNDSDEEEEINVTIQKFPVELICMENCENTLDDLILNNKLTTDEWFSVLMQIIMTLITYQKVFSFTHNDLHTNNIMYNETSKKFIHYYYNKKIYKIPTFGRLFKIIDFGRSIYKFQGKTFCSDSFQHGNDAASQYNTEPYFDEKKPRLEPNFSFDLSRLACSIFDYLIDDLEEIKDLNNIIDPVKKIIVEWCLDDKGINLLYKNNGDERYPDFKLYKMIARHVHNHTPEAQLERPEFKKFIIHESLDKRNTKNDIQNTIKIDIDKIPILV